MASSNLNALPNFNSVLHALNENNIAQWLAVVTGIPACLWVSYELAKVIRRILVHDRMMSFHSLSRFSRLHVLN
jgi:hypothetical protein